MTNTFHPLKSLSPRTLWAAGVLLVGTIIMASALDIQGLLSTGDHGRDLYAFDQTSRGAQPYKDYWWVYGPLMPYYYGLFMQWLGTSIGTVLIAKSVLKLAGAFFIYLAGTTLIAPFASALLAIWYLIFFQDFFFTYNHIGGITTILGIVTVILHYIRNPRAYLLYIALGLCVILSFIKVNFGAAALVACVGGVWFSHRTYLKPESRQAFFYILALVLIPALIVGSYMLLLSGLSIAEIQQCLPYFSEYRQYSTTPFKALSSFLADIRNTITNSIWDAYVASVLIVALIRLVYLWGSDGLKSITREHLLAAGGFLTLFYVLNLHEFIKSGVWYRKFWSHPIGMLMMFVVIYHGYRSLNLRLRSLIWGGLGVCLIMAIGVSMHQISATRTADRFISSERGQAFVTNPRDWVQTVNQTTTYITTHLQGHDFLALPYDPLYYYLTERTSPTRQLFFSDHIHIPEEQELSIIEDIEKKRIPYVLLSNRISSPESGLGFFGETYTPKLARYIDENYSPIAEFGDWTTPVPGWGWHHGTRILQLNDLP